MKRKVLSVVLSGMMAISMLGGCGSAAATTASSAAPSQASSAAASAASSTTASASTAAASSTAAQTTASATESTAAGSTNVTEEQLAAVWKDVAQGPAAGKSDSDYSFFGVFGAVNSYSDPYPGAAKSAAKALGIDNPGFDAPTDWDQTQQNTILDGLVAKGVKGIYMMTSDPTAGNEEISKLVGAGVNVVCVGGSPDTPSKATLTLATDVYQASYDGTINLIKAMGGKGGVVGLCGAVTDTNTQKRMQAIKDACAKYPDVKLVQIIGDVDDTQKATEAIENILAAKKDQINGFVSTCMSPSIALSSILAQDEYQDIHAVGTDTDKAVLEGIKSGALDGTMSQNPYGQAYLATITLKMLADGWTYKDGQDFLIDSGSAYITKDNADNAQQMQMNKTMDLAKTWMDRFNAPTK